MTAALHLRGVLLPGDEERDVYVAGGRLTFTAVPGARTLRSGGWITPGLVDLHAHLGLRTPLPDDAPAEDRARAAAAVHLAAGVLAIREPGSPDLGGTTIGASGAELPRTFSAGRFLALPGRYLPGYAREVPPEEAVAAAVEEAARGGWAKLIGDWRTDDGYQPTFDPDTVRAVTEAVHAAGGRVAVHATHPDSVEAAVAAGADSVEHGLAVGPEHLDRMVERGIALVPTMLAVAGMDDDVARRHAGTVRAAYEAGVRVLAGTDAAVVDHGLVREEVRMLRAAGLPGAAALAAASWDARAFLGLSGVEEGGAADLVVYDADPRVDAEALARPALVVLGGRVVAPS